MRKISIYCGAKQRAEILVSNLLSLIDDSQTTILALTVRPIAPPRGRNDLRGHLGGAPV